MFNKTIIFNINLYHYNYDLYTFHEFQLTKFILSAIVIYCSDSLCHKLHQKRDCVCLVTSVSQTSQSL